jgi:serine/threonine protein kinase
VPLTPGSTFERYEIQSLIGRGGMGEVYRAVDTRLHRPVALKVLRTDKDASASVADAGGVARLLREARAAAALNHANSVAIYELGEAEGIAYIAMELVTGMTLRRYVGEGNVSLETKVSWLVDVARALWAAHKAGLVHRDVKPGNIMVSEEGVVKVLDFGLAKATARRASPDDFQTMMGQVLGTPRYMAPEQLEGTPADAAADQYAFGLTAYELLSGVYAGGPLGGAIPPLDERVPAIGKELGAVVARMMSRHPRDRFPTMEAAAHALRASFASLASSPAAHARFDATVEDGAPASSAPTVVRTVEQSALEEVSASREVPVQVPLEASVAKGSTLPLGVAVKMAMGENAATRLAPPPTFNMTMPLARPMQVIATPETSSPPHGVPPRVPPEPGSSPRMSAGAPALQPGAPSGVYASRSRAQADALRSTDPRRPGYVDPPKRPPSRAWTALLVTAIVAVAAGGIAAWMLK